MGLHICLNLIVLCIYAWFTHSLPQDFDDPTKFFQIMEFDQRHRGSFNITDCIKELLNCWEAIKVDLVCSNYHIFDSVCAIMYVECDENEGFKEKDFIDLWEGYCW